MKKLLLIIFYLIPVIAFSQEGQEDETPIGQINTDDTPFYLDYDIVEWAFFDTVLVNLNQATGVVKFKSGEEYSTNLTLNNPSLKQFKIQSVTNTCACLFSQIPATAINSGANFNLNLKFKALEPGDHEEIINIYAYDLELTRPLVLLNIKVLVSVELNDNN